MGRRIQPVREFLALMYAPQQNQIVASWAQLVFGAIQGFAVFLSRSLYLLVLVEELSRPRYCSACELATTILLSPRSLPEAYALVDPAI